MKKYIVAILMFFTYSASAAYTYTYSNIVPTIYTDYFPTYFGEEPITEARIRNLSFSALLDDRIKPNTFYNNSNLVATSYNDLSGNASGYYTSLDTRSSLAFKTNEVGAISEWDITVGAGRFALFSTKGHDGLSQLGSFDGEFGETSDIGNWKELRVNYIQDELDGYSYKVSPVPEPETYLLLLVGIALISLMAKRQRSQFS